MDCPGNRSEVTPAARRHRKFPHGLWIFLAAFIALQFWQARTLHDGRLPPIHGELASGGMLHLDDRLRAAGERPLLLYIWSSTCPVCRAEEGTISRIATDWPVLTLAMQSGERATVAAFMEERKLAYPALVDAQGEIGWALGVRATPAWFIIDGQRNVRFSGVGLTSGWGLRARLWWARVFA